MSKLIILLLAANESIKKSHDRSPAMMNVMGLFDRCLRLISQKVWTEQEVIICLKSFKMELKQQKTEASKDIVKIVEEVLKK